VTPAERTLRARLAAHTLHAQGGTNMGPARREFLAKFERQVDPQLELDPAERQRRAEHAFRAHMARLSLKAAKARRRKQDEPT
jgi:hypothetical protein